LFPGLAGSFRGLVGLLLRVAGVLFDHGNAVTERIGLRPGVIGLRPARRNAVAGCRQLRFQFSACVNSKLILQWVLAVQQCVIVALQCLIVVLQRVIVVLQCVIVVLQRVIVVLRCDIVVLRCVMVVLRCDGT
jgi:hypothetical protein